MAGLACKARWNYSLRPMRFVTRYIFSQLTYATVFMTLALTMALWLTQSLRLIDYMVNRGLPASSFLELTALLLPSLLSLVLPISTVVAVLFVYNKLTQDSELVVMRASGLSAVQLARPALVLAGVVTLIGYAISLYFLPLSYRNFRDLQFDIRDTYASVLLQEGVFNTIGDDITVYVRARDDDGALVGIIVQDARDKQRPSTLIAERGALVRTDEGPRVLLVNGNRQEVDRETGQLSMLYFERYTVDLAGLSGDSSRRRRDPAERFMSELFNPSERELQDEGFVRELLAEAHSRLSAPLFGLTFTLIALVAMLTGEFNRRGRPHRLALAGVTVGVLFAASLAAQDLANREASALVLLYIVPIVPAIVALVWLARDRPKARRLTVREVPA